MRAEGERRTATESVLEVTYRWVPLPWAKLQPSVQCVLGPHFSGHDALVLGLRATVGLRADDNRSNARPHPTSVTQNLGRENQ